MEFGSRISLKTFSQQTSPPLLASLTEDIDRWDLLPLSLAGRINTIKMVALPKLLYLFQCVPFFLTKKFFISLDRKLSSFIWNKKNPRVRKTVLQRTRQQGGFGLPNFQLYYWAANIKTISHWTNRTDENAAPDWLTLERDSCRNTSLSALLYCRLPYSEPVARYTRNPVIIHSLKIWRQFRQYFQMLHFSVLAPIEKKH